MTVAWIVLLAAAAAVAGLWATAAMAVDLIDMTRRSPVSRLARMLHRGWWPAYILEISGGMLLFTVALRARLWGMALLLLVTMVFTAGLSWWPTIRRAGRAVRGLETW